MSAPENNPPAFQISIKDTITDYLLSIEMTRARKTYLTYQTGMNQFAAFLCGSDFDPEKDDISTLTEQTAGIFAQALSDRRFSPATIKLYLTAVTVFMNTCRWNWNFRSTSIWCAASSRASHRARAAVCRSFPGRISNGLLRIASKLQYLRATPKNGCADCATALSFSLLPIPVCVCTKRAAWRAAILIGTGGRCFDYRQGR